MVTSELASATAEGRTADRSNVFVIATLYCAAGSSPVRVRNLSRSGALVEGSVLPLPGSRVRLSRGSLHAAGEVVWSADGRAGLRFACSIAVPDWLPGGGSANPQQRVDEIVFQAKHSNRVERDERRPSGDAPSADVALELAHLASGLARVCEQLADDPHVAARFGQNLQMIEATAQRLDRLASAAAEVGGEAR